VSFELLKVGAALLLTAPSVPLLFQGEEWGASSPFCYFTDHMDLELAAAVRAGRHREYVALGWGGETDVDPQSPETFELSKLPWEELDRPFHRDLLAWHRSLIELRRSIPALHDGRRDLADVRFEEEARWLVMERGSVSVVCNFSERVAVVPLAAERSRHRLLTSAEAPEVSGDKVRLGPESVTIYSAEPVPDR
jgi:maltooligosyltrehalose trehalohydrolase